MINTVTFLTGRAKSGKTCEILKRIAKNEAAGERSLFIVPSGFTFEAEKMLAMACGGGFMNTTICGFYNLGEKVLSEFNLNNAFITKQGRVMVIRRSISLAKLGIFAKSADKTGFAALCDDLISNFVTCELTPDDIENSAASMAEGCVLREKLKDLAAIYRICDDYLKKTGQVLRAACKTICECIPKSELCNAHIYIDGIENPGDQTYKMITAMLSCAKSLTLAVKCDAADTGYVFKRENEIYAKLRNIVKEAGLDANVIHMKGDKRYAAPVLSHIEKELFSFPSKKFTGDSSAVEIVCATDYNDEINALCAAIIEKANQGVRFKNMAIFTAQPEKYSALLKRVFKNNGIPLFCDEKTAVNSTPAAILINSALRCVCSDFSRNDVIALMKTGLAGVSAAEAEQLENYMLAYDIFGNELFSEFTRAEVPDGVEQTRAKLAAPLSNLKTRCKNENVDVKTDALLNYLDELSVKEKLECIAERFDSCNETALKAAYSQVWDFICETLAQLKNVLGDSKMGMEKFALVVKEGLAADIISVIPAGADMVSFGALSLSALPNIEYAFVIGANEGSFPIVRNDDGVIDDKELSDIKATGLSVWLSAESKREQDNESIYTTLTLPQKGLYISYPQNTGSESAKPAACIERLLAMLDRTPVQASSYKIYNIQSAADILRSIASGKAVSCEDEAYLSYCLNKKSGEVEKLLDAVYFNSSPKPLDEDIAAQLFKNKNISATRIERYNECPYSHFLKYGLRAKERKEYKEKTVDSGALCHEILDRFVKYVVENEIDCKTVTDDELGYIVDTIADTVKNEYNGGMFMKNSRYAAKCEYMINVAKDTVAAVVAQMKSGDFEFMCSEAEFKIGDDALLPPIKIPLGNGITYTLSGKIDRIDSFTDENGKKNIRVIDYKSGGKKFSFTEFYNGVQLQLPLYLSAVEAACDISCAMLYMPIITFAVDAAKDDITKELLKKYKMRGIILDEPRVALAMDRHRDEKGKTDVVAENMSIERKTYPATLSREKIDKIKKFACEKAKQTALNILSGKIPVSPYKNKDKDACKYCPYKSVCMFDENLPECEFNTPETVFPNTIFNDND